MGFSFLKGEKKKIFLVSKKGGFFLGFFLTRGGVSPDLQPVLYYYVSFGIQFHLLLPRLAVKQESEGKRGGGGRGEEKKRKKEKEEGTIQAGDKRRGKTDERVLLHALNLHYCWPTLSSVRGRGKGKGKGKKKKRGGKREGGEEGDSRTSPCRFERKPTICISLHL